MRWSYKLATIAGTEIKVHITFLVFIAWVAFSTYSVSGAEAAFQVTLFFLALFVCIVLHEFGHILMAGRFGVRTPDVILLPIGGVAMLSRSPSSARASSRAALRPARRR